MYLEGRFEDGEWDGGVDSKQKSGDRSAPAVLRPLEVWMELSEGRKTNQRLVRIHAYGILCRIAS